MASQIELAQGSVNLRLEPIRSAYFRAALAELIRVEDITDTLGNKFKFIETHDPLLHAIKLLRNYQVHIGTVSLDAGAVSVQWGDQIGVYEFFIADNLSVHELRKLNSANVYSSEQLGELIELFDINQRKLGVVQLLYHTCLHICDVLAKA